MDFRSRDFAGLFHGHIDDLVAQDHIGHKARFSKLENHFKQTKHKVSKQMESVLNQPYLKLAFCNLNN